MPQLQDEEGGEPLPPLDNAGCFYFALRTGCGMGILWILMGLGIIFAALVSLLFYR